jgi:hypothetical protein
MNIPPKSSPAGLPGVTSVEEQKRAQAKAQGELVSRAAAGRQPALSRAVRNLAALGGHADGEQGAEESGAERNPHFSHPAAAHHAVAARVSTSAMSADTEGSSRGDAAPDTPAGAAPVESTAALRGTGRVQRVGDEPVAAGADADTGPAGMMAGIGWGVAVLAIVALAAAVAGLVWPPQQAPEEPAATQACLRSDEGCEP